MASRHFPRHDTARSRSGYAIFLAKCSDEKVEAFELGLGMPDLEWNVNLWDGHYDWPKLGDEWSECGAVASLSGLGRFTRACTASYRLAPFWKSLQASDGGHSSFFRYAGNTWESTSLANVSKVAKAAPATSAMPSS